MKRITTGSVSAVLLLSTFACSSGKVRAAAPPPAPVVEVALVVQKTVPIMGEWVGTLDGYVNAQIQPQVSGYLIRQDYHEDHSFGRDNSCWRLTRGRFKRY
jgi:membrane fusion protein, multidrug efflux system